jgi:hypothetical protein
VYGSDTFDVACCDQLPPVSDLTFMLKCFVNPCVGYIAIDDSKGFAMLMVLRTRARRLTKPDEEHHEGRPSEADKR